MTPAARVASAIALLDEIIEAARTGGAAADVVATRYFKQRRYAGSGDRRAIRELVWRPIRRFGEIPISGRAAIVALADDDAALHALFDGSVHGPLPMTAAEPRAAGGVIPAWIDGLLAPCVNEADRASLLERAPLDLRINRARADGVALPDGELLPAPLDGLRLTADTAIMECEAYRCGALEIQDAGSQWITHACGVKPGMTVVDLCAGAGGKTLALWAAMGGEGRLIACDTDRRRLGELAPRALRAGAHGIEQRLLNPGQELAALDDLLGMADLVLIDAPCSGTGTWRRNPEARWRLTPKRLERLQNEQARLLDIGSKLVTSDGSMLYAVCAITGGEGEQQVSAFMKRSGWQAQRLALRDEQGRAYGRAAGDGLLLTPSHDGCDGFFMARLCR